MQNGWLHGVILDLKKCADNYGHALLAHKLEEAHHIAIAMDESKNLKINAVHRAKSIAQSANVIDIALARKKLEKSND